MEIYIVYVKTNDDGYITAINSGEFLTDLNGWTKIDEGVGDKYHHAQGNYFPGPISTESGACRYKLVAGEAVECTEEEIAAQKPSEQPEERNETSVWDELDAAYQAGYAEGYTEGVNSAYDQ